MPGDVHEKEADRIAEQVMRMPAPQVQSKAAADISGHTIESAAQVQTKSTQAGDSGGAAVPPIVHEVLRSPGQPLDAATRAFMEPRFGQDFSRVRVHTDHKAADAAQSINAVAYTIGHDIAFDRGRYGPASAEGSRLLAHELTHVVQQRSGTRAVMRQTAHGEVEDAAVADKDESQPHQCSDDVALEQEFDEWIHYDPEKDTEENALVNRINREVFGPINQERNKLVADSFENTEAQKKAFPTATLEDNPSAARKKLFYTPTYARLHSTDSMDKVYQEDVGLTRPAGDFAASGKVVPNVFGAPPRVHAHWDYRGDKARTVGRKQEDATGGDFLKVDGGGIKVADRDHLGEDPDAVVSSFDSTIGADGVKAESNVSGFAEFSDRKSQSIFVPQLGFPRKPRIDTKQVMCRQVPVVKAGRAKRLSGPAGRHVAGRSLRYIFHDIFHRGKHFFGEGTSPKIVGAGEALGWRAGPGKPVRWWRSQLPADSENTEEKGESARETADDFMRKQADAIIAHKRDSYEKLKDYYLERAAYIEKYKSLLK